MSGRLDWERLNEQRMLREHGTEPTHDGGAARRRTSRGRRRSANHRAIRNPETAEQRNDRQLRTRSWSGDRIQI